MVSEDGFGCIFYAMCTKIGGLKNPHFETMTKKHLTTLLSKLIEKWKNNDNTLRCPMKNWWMNENDQSD